MGGEGPRRCPAHQRVHHRRLDLDEAAPIEELAKEADQRRPPEEDLLHLGVRDQVQVALAVARLHVGQAVPLLRGGPERLGERQELGGSEGQLPGLAPEERALHPHEVAQVGELEALELVTQRVLLDVDLKLAAPVAELEECRLAEAAQGHHPAGDGVGLRRCLELLGRLARVLPPDVPREVDRTEPVPERVAPQGAPALGLVQALAVELLLLRRLGLVAHVGGLSYSGTARLGFFTPRSWAVTKESRSPSSTASTLPVSTPVRRSFTSR